MQMHFTNLCQHFLVSTSVREKEKIVFCLCALFFSVGVEEEGGGGGLEKIKKKERKERTKLVILFNGSVQRVITLIFQVFFSSVFL